MRDDEWIKLICTLGPSSLSPNVLRDMDELGVSIFRLNMSHTPTEGLDGLIRQLRQVTRTLLCIDTEGAQIRTGRLLGGAAELRRDAEVTLVRGEVEGTESAFTLRPPEVFDYLEPGTLLSVDFNGVLLLVRQSDHLSVRARVLCGGRVQSNKGVSANREIPLSPLTEKDRVAVEIARRNGINLFALSFASSEAAVRSLRQVVGPGATVMAKVESRAALAHIDQIILASDAIVLDRGDLSRDVAVEELPFLQKSIIRKAHQRPVPIYVATNLLESMVSSPFPSRAEVNDIVSTLLDGANGLVLAAETAIGRYPVRCVSMVRRLINQYEAETWRDADIASAWRGNGMLANRILPHGGRLLERLPTRSIATADMGHYSKLVIDLSAVRDVEQIASGCYSPVRGFMNRDEIDSVLDSYMLCDGTVWTLPIVLQASSRDIKGTIGDTLLLVCGCCNKAVSLIKIKDIFVFDKQSICRRWFGTANERHPGVARLQHGGDCFIGGEVTLLERHRYASPEYCLSPAQVRAIVAHSGWEKTVGFHTRNVPHRAHEYMQLQALERVGADALLIHPVLGSKRSGDFTQEAILAGYEALIKTYYPKDRVVLTGFYSNSWYSGPREAVFTAICRKNFGCSHFIVGRDHTGVGNFYNSSDVMALFEKLGDIGIKPVFFNQVVYDPNGNRYRELQPGEDRSKMRDISGTEVRAYITAGEAPPEWMMRREVSEVLLRLAVEGRGVVEP